MKTIIETRKNGTRRVALRQEQESLTEQNHADYCGINVIMARYRETGHIPQAPGSPLYGDFTGAQDFMECCARIKAAEQAFDTIPADIREKFNNNAAALIEFINNPDNAADAAAMGLIAPPESQPSQTDITAENPTPPPQSDGITAAVAAASNPEQPSG